MARRPLMRKHLAPGEASEGQSRHRPRGRQAPESSGRRILTKIKRLAFQRENGTYYIPTDLESWEYLPGTNMVRFYYKDGYFRTMTVRDVVMKDCVVRVKEND